MKALAVLLVASINFLTHASVGELNEVLSNTTSVRQRIVELSECKVQVKSSEALYGNTIINRDITSYVDLSTLNKNTLKLEKDGVIFFTKNFEKTIEVDVISFDNAKDELIEYSYETSALKIRIDKGSDFLTDATQVRDLLFSLVKDCE